MKEKYIVIKGNDSKLTELKNKYFKYCIEKEQVFIVITALRKYARIEYDFDTLNNDKRHIVALSSCNIGDKIREYVMQYSTEKNLPSSHMPKVVSDVAGGFEFFIEDIEKVGNDISAIIDKIVQSGCIKYETKEEMIAKLSPDELKAMKEVFGEEYFVIK